jgi:hypothetical protein
MSRVRPAAALLAAAALIALAGASAAVGVRTPLHGITRLSPTPPVPLPAHLPARPQPAKPAKPAKPLPKTGMALAPELLAALLLLALGVGARALARRRVTSRGRLS